MSRCAFCGEIAEHIHRRQGLILHYCEECKDFRDFISDFIERKILNYKADKK